MRKFWDLPAGWRGDALQQRQDWTYRFSEEDVAEIDAALTKAKTTSKSLRNITATDFPLPRFTKHLVQILKTLEEGSGAHYMRGFPIERYNEDDLRLIFWGLAQHLGMPVSQSATGERIFSVRDEGFGLGHVKARGPNTSKGLSFHTDRCDVIGFMCLKQAKSGGRNYLVSSVTLYNEIASRRPDLLEALHKPYPYLRHNVDTANPKPYITQPVFSECEGHFAANLLRVLINRAVAHPEVPPVDPIQIEALDFLEEVAAEPELHTSFRQEPGDLLFVNNWLLLHSRDRFEDFPDSRQRRHLLRVWLSVPNSRPLSDAYRGNYGNVAAGAIRGGMPERMD